MSNAPRKPGRPSGITKAKLTVTIDAGLTKKARKLAGQRNTTLSALLQEAVMKYMREVMP